MTSTPLHDMLSVQRSTFSHWLISQSYAKEPIKRWVCQLPANPSTPPPTVKSAAALAVASQEGILYILYAYAPNTLHFKAWLHQLSAIMNFKIFMICVFMLPLTMQTQHCYRWRRYEPSTDINLESFSHCLPSLRYCSHFLTCRVISKWKHKLNVTA